MSLEARRRETVGKRNALTERRRSLRSTKRTLRNVTHLIAKNGPLSNLINCHYTAEHSPPPDADESTWLEKSDISNGLHFDDTSLPYPPTPVDDDATHTSKPLNPSLKSVKQVQETIEPTVAALEDDIAATPDPTSSSAPATRSRASRTTPAVPDSEEDEAQPVTYAQKARDESDGPAATPAVLAPPQPEEEAEFSADTQRLLDTQSPQRPAKVVHLPPEDVQRERSRELEEHRRRRSEEDTQTKHTRSHVHAQTELASSPSSTVGPYSAATPMPPQDSPDTSPDSETGDNLEVLPPPELRPSPDEQREKEEHDRLLAAQKAIAHRAALGDLSTPDDQLRFEERQASAREAEERAAREDRNGPEPDGINGEDETQAESVMEGVERDRNEAQPDSDDTNNEQQRESGTGAKEGTKGVRDDGDNITVTPRMKSALHADPTQQNATDASRQDNQAEQARMRTRTSSGVLQKRSVSEILGQTPSRRDLLSSATATPMNSRLPQGSPTATPSHLSMSIPERPARHTEQARTLLDELNALKGASEDPDRDYLEPLFRIQAHDSPNNRTTSLADLTRASTKTLSTEDHFAHLQERVDYRILRRIYQLQNANKWSLRQMQRCKEPDQPVTHHDHMMVEMQWMRKDFRAERKMKKSICAWLAQRCADWVAASSEERMLLQVKVKPARTVTDDRDDVPAPELEQADDSAADDAGPPTPPNELSLPANLVVAPELTDAVSALQQDGKLGQALRNVPVADLSSLAPPAWPRMSVTLASKYIDAKVLPDTHGCNRKRSRFEYDDDAEMLEFGVVAKRAREERSQRPEDEESALFHPDNKPIRDRLHANNAFRPPSEFVMPSTQFYEFRNGSQWLKEDDDKLKRLAKDYAFNWSLIADELQLYGVFKSSSERRTPWECFERWVELEQLPAEMKKTIYFKTWYQRLEQSQQAAERRYQAQVAALQAASNGQASHIPMRRRTVPSRVEKRKNTRYIWMTDAMRKLARKKEQQAFKQAEAHRAAAQRKAQAENNQPRSKIPSPREFSDKRYEKDVQDAEKMRKQRQQMLENQQRQLLAARQAAMQQQGLLQGQSNQPRPGSSANMPAAQQAQMQANGQQQAQMNGQISQQARQQALQMAARNAHLAAPQMNAQGVQQAQMRGNGQMPNAQDMQRIAQANAQARNAQYGGGQQQYQMPSANMMSPGGGGMAAQQMNPNNQAMLANMQQQMHNAGQQGGNQQMSGSPIMPPPPTRHSNSGSNPPQSLSSGHVPNIISIRAHLRSMYPHYTDEQIDAKATDALKLHSQSSSQARQTAMNAAAGISPSMGAHSNMQAYGHIQAAYQNNQIANGGANFMGAGGGDPTGQQAQPNGMPPAASPSPQQYAALMRQRQMAQMRMQQSPNGSHASLNGSPNIAVASPNMAPVSPNMQFSNMNQMPSMNNMGGAAGAMTPQQRPPSRSNTPQIQRVGSSGNMSTGGMASPQAANAGLQGSPRNMQASVAR
ncbi:hypothetical protein BDY17DRAFT_300634 [Neohortaea acidophila]|uniref:Vacuolar import and degradation protein 21 n=1 Tax=Neohortaea acidophila TaxID=245834 RepID=A0A6A6PMZ6_9PEZI|nr:uncharacterized protein BDY17DRAFT_300634 [Neohortaea acidophila]KAF2481061.1 hypothetical protein BDY17DRAFT_300634 [Neohortaea acidophila]